MDLKGAADRERAGPARPVVRHGTGGSSQRAVVRRAAAVRARAAGRRERRRAGERRVDRRGGTRPAAVRPGVAGRRDGGSSATGGSSGTGGKAGSSGTRGLGGRCRDWRRAVARFGRSRGDPRRAAATGTGGAAGSSSTDGGLVGVGAHLVRRVQRRRRLGRRLDEVGLRHGRQRLGEQRARVLHQRHRRTRSSRAGTWSSPRPPPVPRATPARTRRTDPVSTPARASRRWGSSASSTAGSRRASRSRRGRGSGRRSG